MSSTSFLFDLGASRYYCLHISLPWCLMNLFFKLISFTKFGNFLCIIPLSNFFQTFLYSSFGIQITYNLDSFIYSYSSVKARKFWVFFFLFFRTHNLYMYWSILSCTNEIFYFIYDLKLMHRIFKIRLVYFIGLEFPWIFFINSVFFNYLSSVYSFWPTYFWVIAHIYNSYFKVFICKYQHVSSHCPILFFIFLLIMVFVFFACQFFFFIVFKPL